MSSSSQIFSLILFFFALNFSVSAFAQNNEEMIPTPENKSGYASALPYIQENAVIRREARKKYSSRSRSRKIASHRSRRTGARYTQNSPPKD